MKLLVNTPFGSQEVIEVGEGGGYFDKSAILWDERIDGDMPMVTLGGMVREGDEIRFSQEAFDAYEERPIPSEEVNAAILAELMRIDAKSIRAIREGDQDRIAEWNAQAAALRAKIVK